MLPDRDERDHGPEEGEALRSRVCDVCRRIDCEECDSDAPQGSRQTGGNDV